MKKVLAIVLALCMVASLGVMAFAEDAKTGWEDLDVACVIIADGITKVEAAPFAGMKDLESVVLPASVEEFEDDVFADAAITAVSTAGDVELLKDVAAFDDAEVTEITAEDFDALVAEVEEAATVTTDSFCYDEATKTLLVKAFSAEKAAAVPAVVAPSQDESEVG
ncbi:MAG: hypothetical protein IJV40_15290 [Oscillospiraceae bacterium]|nr:hypothetical protein [Oscillospiraceae bacterium]